MFCTSDGISNSIMSSSYFQESVRQHEETFDERNPRDLIDDYLIELKKAEQSPDKPVNRKGTKNGNFTFKNNFPIKHHLPELQSQRSLGL